jgi:hypothetical protein
MMPRGGIFVAISGRDPSSPTCLILLSDFFLLQALTSGFLFVKTYFTNRLSLESSRDYQGHRLLCAVQNRSMRIYVEVEIACGTTTSFRPFIIHPHTRGCGHAIQHLSM